MGPSFSSFSTSRRFTAGGRCDWHDHCSNCAHARHSAAGVLSAASITRRSQGFAKVAAQIS
jgi:hypothetical protein